MNERRLGQIRIDGAMLMDILTEGGEGHLRCIKGIPADSVVVSTHFDIDRQCAYLVISSPSLPITREGYPIPWVPIEIEFTGRV